MVVKFKELRDMLDVLVKYYEDTMPTIEVDIDFYNKLRDKENINNIEIKDADISLGSFVDDIEELRKMVKEEEHFASSVDWDRLGNVLTIISIELRR